MHYWIWMCFWETLKEYAHKQIFQGLVGLVYTQNSISEKSKHNGQYENKN